MNVVFRHNSDYSSHAPRTTSSKSSVRVSVLINNYNYGQFVSDAISSALRQSHNNLEVIVVDDGSTDNSVQVISELQLLQQEIRLIRKENGGQASAMNAGYAASSGDYVIFLDSDDVLDANAVEEALASFCDDTAFVQFFLRTIDRHGMITGLHPFCHVVEHGQVFRQVLTSGNFRFMPTSGNLFRREALAPVFPLPEDNWRICADSFLVTAAAAWGRVVTKAQILGSYRTHGANAWFEEEESPDRLREISRNHVRLWLDLLPVVQSKFHHESAGLASLSLIRRIAIGACVAPAGAFTAADFTQYRHSLRGVLGSLEVSRGERILHWLMINTIGAQNARIRLAQLLGYRDTSSVLGRIREFMVSQERHQWLEVTPEPAHISELVPGELIEFGQHGNGRDYVWYGFGSSENWANWSSSERFGLIFKVPESTPTLELKLDLAPLLTPPAISSQPIEIEAYGECLFKGDLIGRMTICLKLSRRLIAHDRDRVVRLHFRAAKAHVPSLLESKSRINRIVALGLYSMRVEKIEQRPRTVPYVLPCKILPTDVTAWAVFHSGWDLVGGVARQTNLKSQIRFALPNPVMDCFAITLDFERPGIEVLGDWTVRLSSDGLGRDSIDLRQSGQLMIIVPKGKAPRNGIFNLVVESSNFLPVNPDGSGKSGCRLKSIGILGFKMPGQPLSILRDSLTLAFTDRGNGRAYLKSGWLPPEASGTWSNSSRSVISGMFFNRDTEIFLNVGLSTLMMGTHIGKQSVLIEANGVRIAAQSIEGHGEILAVIPRGTIGHDCQLQLVIHSSAVGNPHLLGSYAEKRPVGVCVKSLKVQSLA